MGYLLDTHFLVGLWRERERSIEARFLDANGGTVIVMPWIAKAEFMAGAFYAQHDLASVAGFLAPFPLALPTADTLDRYAQAFALLRRTQRHVGANDLWIAATALERGLPVLTRNVREFSRVDGLRVIDYAAA